MIPRFVLTPEEQGKLRRAVAESELELRVSDLSSDSLSPSFFTIFLEGLRSKSSEFSERNYTNYEAPVPGREMSKYRKSVSELGDQTFIQKTRVNTSSSRLEKRLSCFRIRSGEAVETLLSPEEIINIQFTPSRQIRRYTIVVEDIIYELSQVQFPNKPLTYELEIELPKTDLVNYAVKAISILLNILYSRSYSPPDDFNVLDENSVLAHMDSIKRMVGDKASGTAFSSAVNPVNLKDLSKLDEFSVTNKLDGERKLIIHLGLPYLIVMQAGGYNPMKPNSFYIIKNTSKVLIPPFILDAEYYEKVYHIFDMMYMQGRVDINGQVSHLERMREVTTLLNYLKGSPIRSKVFYTDSFQMNMIAFCQANNPVDFFEHNDGLIFTKKSGSYRSTVHYKFKFPSKMSIDFRLRFVGANDYNQNIYNLTVMDRQQEVHFKKYTINSFSPLPDGTIMECVFISNTWIPLRLRPDKPFPNSLMTANDVFQDIERPISFTTLTRGLGVDQRFVDTIERMDSTFFIDLSIKSGKFLYKSFDSFPAKILEVFVRFSSDLRSLNKGDVLKTYSQTLLFDYLRTAVGLSYYDRYILNNLPINSLMKPYRQYENVVEMELLNEIPIETPVIESRFLDKTRIGSSYFVERMRGLVESVLDVNPNIKIGRFKPSLQALNPLYGLLRAVEDHSNPTQPIRISQYSSLMPWHMDQVSSIMRKWFPNGFSSYVDMTSHVGVDVIHMSKLFPNASFEAYEIEPTFYDALVNNVNETNSSIRPLLGDACYDAYIYWEVGKYDIVYMDPPWGGKGYQEQDRVDLYLQAESDKNKLAIRNALEVAKFLLSNNITNYVILKTPVNFNDEDVFKYFTSQQENIINKGEVSYRIYLLSGKAGPLFQKEDLITTLVQGKQSLVKQEIKTLMWTTPYCDSIPRLFLSGHENVLVRVPTDMVRDYVEKMYREWLMPITSTLPSYLIQEKELFQTAEFYDYKLTGTYTKDDIKYLSFKKLAGKPVKPVLSSVPSAASSLSQAPPRQVVSVPTQAPQAPQASQARPPPDSFHYMRKYHNTEKKLLINLYCKNKRVLDLGAGYGGDLSKYSEANVSRLFLVEPSLENIGSAEGLNDRLSKMVVKDRSTIINAKGQETRKILSYVQAEERVDVVASFFSMTFLFESIENLRLFLQTTNACLREGGYFIGTMMEGAKSYELLEGKREHHFDKAHIKKFYQDDGKAEMGKKLWINIDDTIVKDQDEYLAFFSILKDEMERLGFVLELYYDFDPDRAYDKNKMNDKTKDFSRLNSSFVFRKMPRSIPSDILPLEQIENQRIDNLYGESGYLYRSGVLDNNSSFYHSFLYLYDLSYRADKDVREQKVAALKNNFSRSITLEQCEQFIPYKIQKYKEEKDIENIESSSFLREIKDSVLGGLTTVEHLILFMNYTNINIYVMDSNSRVPDHTLLKHYSSKRKFSLFLLQHPQSRFEPLWFSSESKESLEAKYTLGPFDKKLIYLHQWILKKSFEQPSIAYTVPVSKSRLPTFESVEVDVSAPQPRISMEEVKEGPAIEVIGSVFVGSKKPGDFEWMITRDEYKDSLFLFNDDEGRHDLSIKGQGTAIIRPYNNKGQYKNRPRSAGIITGSKTKGYTKLDSKSKAKIDESIEEARKIISEQGYKRVFYSADDKGDLGTGLFVVAPEVIRYTTERIKSLSQ